MGDTSSLIYRFLGIDDGAGAEFDRMGAKTKMLGDESLATAAKLKKLALGAGVAGAVIAIGAVKMAADFQTSMLRIQTQANGSAAEVKALSKGVLDMAGSVASTPMALSNAAYHIASIGQNSLTTAQQLNILRTAAEGSKIGGADLTDVTNALDAAIVSGISGVKNYSQAMGVLNSTVGAGDMTMQDLADAFGPLGAVLKGYNVTIQQAGAALAVFGDNNLRGAKAGTQLRMAVQAMAVPTLRGQGLLEKWGISAGNLSKQLEHGGLTDALDTLMTKMRAAGVTAKDQGDVLTQAFGKRAGVGLAVLEGQLTRFHTKLAEVSAGANSFGASWIAYTHSFGYAWDSAKASAEAMMIELGDKLLPTATKLMTFISGTAIPVLKGGFTEAWKVAGGAIRVASDVLSPLVGVLDHNRKAVEDLAVAVAAMWLAFKGFEVAKLAIAALSDLFAVFAQRAMAVQNAIGGIGSKLSSMSTLSLAGGIALGALGAVVGGLTYAWQKNAQAAAELKAITQQYYGLLEQTKGAINRVIVATLTQSLTTDGAYASAKKYGISLSTVTQAALGNKGAQKQLLEQTKGNVAAMTGVTAKVIQQGDALRTASQQYTLATTAARTYKDSLTGPDRATIAVNSSTGDLSKTLVGLTPVVGVASAALVTNYLAQKEAAASAAALADALKALVTAFQSLVNTEIAQKQSQDGLKEGLMQFTAQVKTNGTELNQSTTKGLANRDMLLTWLQSAESAAEKSKNYGATMIANVKQFAAWAEGAGLSKTKVDALLTSLHLMPKQIRAGITLDTSQAIRALQKLIDKEAIAGGIVTGGQVAVATNSGHRNDFRNAGADIWKGVAAGIDSGSAPTKKAAEHLAGGIKKAFADSMGISSPSKVFYEYGLWIVEGLIGGVEVYSINSRQVARELAIGFITGWKDGSSKLKDALSTPVQKALEQLTTVGQNALAKQQKILKTDHANLKSLLSQRKQDIVSLAGNVSSGADLSGLFGTNAAGNPTTANVSTFLSGQAKSIENFAKDLKWAARHHLSPILLSEIAGLGAAQGDAVLKQFMSGAASITAANSAEATIQRYSTSAATTAEDAVYARRIAKDGEALKKNIEATVALTKAIEKAERADAKALSTHISISASGHLKVDKKLALDLIKEIKELERAAGKKLI